jgi:uracil-DNA glycosylase family 4
MSDIFDDLKKYFNQQQEMYGENIYLSGTLQDPEKITVAQPQTTPAPKPVVAGKTAGSTASKTIVTGGPLANYNQEIRECLKCELGNTRTNFVFGTGNPNADLMFIGEAPGRDEDLQGIPFVGRAGQLLNLMLAAIGIQREDVYIANVLKCRPPNNRDPLPDEIEKCEPYLLHQIDLIKPKVMVALGRIAATTILRSKSSLGGMRKQIHQYNKRPLIVTYHPAALLRNPLMKREAWQDLKMIRDTLKSN